MGQQLIPAPGYRTPGGVSSLASQVSVSAVATTTTIINYLVPINTLAVGTTYRLFASGTVDNAAASPTFNWSLRVGGVSIATAQIPSVTAATSAKAWTVEGLLTLRVVGASGKIVGSIQLLNEIAATFTAAVNIDSPIVNAGTFNTTTALSLDLVMFMGAAAAGNIMRAETGSIELVRL